MTSPILGTLKLGHPWQTLDPFLFCVHHLDHYPAGNSTMGLDPDTLRGRQLGSDFSGTSGWSMYHGEEVPGFPPHPHRGFETITLARQGFIDHADSLGARARFGQGDVQWMTAGRGVMHSEMFPLVHEDKENPTELFQIWLNLPARSKMVDPHFTMFWHEHIPTLFHTNDHGATTTVTAIAGDFEGALPQAPPPESWASRADAHVGIFTLSMDPGATFDVPIVSASINRMLYFFEGDRLAVAGTEIVPPTGLHLSAAQTTSLENVGDQKAQVLMLQGRPIGEPVVQYGPFVMNTQGEIRQAMLDYQRTKFGDWPHQTMQPVWPKTQGRFAHHADGRSETP